jgi:transglutaminase superfamily protein
MPTENPVMLANGATPAVPAVASPALRVPLVFRCGLLITWIKLLLRARGFLGTLGWIRRRIERIPATEAANPEEVRAAEYVVAMAGALYPGRAKCLEQSLTLYYLLRRRGVAAKYCQGVQPYPFQAHAWIEYRGEVINDVPEHAQFFARLPEQLP